LEKKALAKPFARVYVKMGRKVTKLQGTKPQGRSALEQ
jgi:hypothetical protein